jgi:hypothetical protein
VPLPLPIIRKHKNFLFFTLPHIQPSVSPSILPLPRSIYYHSNRIDLLFRTTPLPPIHCHPPCHYHPILKLLLDFFSCHCLTFNHPYLGQYCHCHALSTTNRTALISSFVWYHSHPTTATTAPPSTPPAHTFNGGHLTLALTPPLPGLCALWLEVASGGLVSGTGGRVYGRVGGSGSVAVDQWLWLWLWLGGSMGEVEKKK